MNAQCIWVEAQPHLTDGLEYAATIVAEDIKEYKGFCRDYSRWDAVKDLGVFCTSNVELFIAATRVGEILEDASIADDLKEYMRKVCKIDDGTVQIH